MLFRSIKPWLKRLIGSSKNNDGYQEEEELSPWSRIISQGLQEEDVDKNHKEEDSLPIIRPIIANQVINESEASNSNVAQSVPLMWTKIPSNRKGKMTKQDVRRKKSGSNRGV